MVCESRFALLTENASEPLAPRDATSQRVGRMIVYTSVENPPDVTEEILERLNRSTEDADPPADESPAKAAAAPAAQVGGCRREDVV